MVRHPSSRVTLVLGLLLAAVRADAAEPAPAAGLPVRPLASRPTKELIQRALAGGVCWREGSEEEGPHVEIRRDGSATIGGGESPSWECMKPTPVQVGPDSFQWTCEVQTLGQAFENDVPVDKDLGVKKTTFRYHVALATPDVLVVESKNAGRQIFVLSSCKPGDRCRDCGEGGDRSLVELVPGSSDRALFEKVKASLASAQELQESSTLLFEGGPARDPRTTTEVYYSRAGAKDWARYLADLLRPVIGPVEPKPWPGAWDYDIVVVVGKAKAP